MGVLARLDKMQMPHGGVGQVDAPALGHPRRTAGAPPRLVISAELPSRLNGGLSRAHAPCDAGGRV